MERWSTADSAKIYNLDNWGGDLFSINKKGNICVHPSPTSKYSIDLRMLMDDLLKRMKRERQAIAIVTDEFGGTVTRIAAALFRVTSSPASVSASR